MCSGADVNLIVKVFHAGIVQQTEDCSRGAFGGIVTGREPVLLNIQSASEKCEYLITESEARSLEVEERLCVRFQWLGYRLLRRIVDRLAHVECSACP